MNIAELLPFLHFFATIVYWYLSIYIVAKNPKSLVNRVCAVFLMTMSIWSFSMTFIHNLHVAHDTARLFVDISAIGWCGFGSAFLWFILAYTGKRDTLGRKWLYVILAAIPLIMLYLQWSNHIYVSIEKMSFGWKTHMADSPWPLVFAAYYISFVGIGLYMTVDFMRKTGSPVLKKQARIIFVTILASLVLGTVTDTVLPLLGLHRIPNLADVLSLIWAFGVVYAIVRYRFLVISPITAAGNIISTMFDCLVLLDMEGGIVTVNKAAERVLGYNRKELKGVPLETVMPREGDLVRRTVEEGGLKNRDCFFRKKDGGAVPVIFSSSVLRDETGAAGGIVCVAKDISERKRLEEEAFKHKKLESIGMLAGGIAHDFNNLLATIIGNLSLAAGQLPPGHTSGKLLTKAETVSMKAADLARKFISLSPGGWLDKKDVHLDALLEEMKAKGLPGVTEGEAGVNYLFDIPADLWTVAGDEDQLAQAMGGLFDNAVEAMPAGKGGNIAVRAENAAVEPENEFLLKAGNYVKITIRDTGDGVAAQHLEKVFDPYFSTKNKTAQKGMGLGLTLCYSIVKKHDGHITIKSEEGKGALVTIYLPAPKHFSLVQPCDGLFV